MLPGCSFSIVVRQLLPSPVGRTHASSVIPVVRSRLLASATVTRSLTPSKVSALPNFPAVVHVGPLIVPTLPLPELSAAAVPMPASKPHSPTRPGGGPVGTTPLACGEGALSLPAGSTAVTR